MKKNIKTLADMNNLVADHGGDNLFALKYSIIAYKYLTKDSRSPIRTNYYESIKYRWRRKYTRNMDMSPLELCGMGINVATYEWAKNQEYQAWIRTPGLFSKDFMMRRFFIKKGTLVCVPIGSDGKFRVASVITGSSVGDE